MKDALRLLPDLLRLIKRLASNRSLAVGVRVRLVLLLAYLLLPIDLLPDFIPVIRYADDAVVVALVLRSVLKRARPEALERNWLRKPGRAERHPESGGPGPPSALNSLALSVLFAPGAVSVEARPLKEEQ